MELIFLTGHRKSGTTLLHNLFDGHPNLNNYPVDISLLYAFFPCNVDFNQNANRKRISQVIRISTEGLNGQFIYNSGIKFNSDDLLDVFWKNAGSLKFDNPYEIVKILIESWVKYAQLNPDLPCVIKETSQAINIYKYEELGLSCKYIHLVRDPRDNYAAIFEGVETHYKNFGENRHKSLASLINRARMDLIVASRLLENEKQRFFALKFEDLLHDARKSMTDICSFLEIPLEDALFHPTKLGKDDFGNNHSGRKFTGISAENLGRWKERLSSEDIGVIEFWLHNEMKHWGYPLSLDSKTTFQSFSKFYDWYNCEYFFHDSFKE